MLCLLDPPGVVLPQELCQARDTPTHGSARWWSQLVGSRWPHSQDFGWRLSGLLKLR